jgi:ribosomal-protein-alanine N-acetyltransferase
MSALRIHSASRDAADARSVTPEVVVTQMRRRHLRAVLRIEERTSSTPWSHGLFLAEARRPERVYLVARMGSTVVGFAGLLFALTDGHVTTIAVDPERQGARIGTRLMLVLIREAIARGATAVTLEVRASNEAALALYRRFGFAPVGTRKGYYRHPDEDALVLWAHEVNTEEFTRRLEAIEASLDTPLVVERLAALPTTAPPATDLPTADLPTADLPRTSEQDEQS